MALKRISLPKNQGAFLSAQTINQLLDCADGDVALLYLYLMSQNGEFDDGAAADRLQMSVDNVAGALDRMARLGLIERGNAPVELPPERADTIPEYTARDVADMISRDSSFQYLLDFTQKRLGKILSTVDTQTLLGIYNWLGLPVDVICLLVTSCVDEMRRKYGEGRVPTMRNIEQRARTWASLGIMTHAQVEEHLQTQEKRGKRSAELARLLHINDRVLSPTEQRYISAWVDIRIPDELVLKAYDITVVKTGGLKWKYMDTILKSWAAKGYTTAEQLERGENVNSAGSNGQQGRRERQTELESVRRLRELNRVRRGEEK